MLFESSHLCITAEYGIATLWLGFPGPAVNALDLARLRELDRALQALEATRSVQIVVVRSSNSKGFCVGIDPAVHARMNRAADRAAFAWYGQQVFERLGNLNAVTIANIEGPCLGAGLELALACDYRLCIARPGTYLGFPDGLTSFGGSVRLRRLIGRRAEQLLSSGRLLSGREAQSLRLIDRACCERRGKIELRNLLDRVELNPLKPRPLLEPFGFAAERRAFAALTPFVTPKKILVETKNPVPAFPDTIGLLGDHEDAAMLAAEAAARGVTTIVQGNRDLVSTRVDAIQKQGFITPLEAQQTKNRVVVTESLTEFRRAGLVFVAPGHNHFCLSDTVLPRTVVCIIGSRENLDGIKRFDEPSDWSPEGLDEFPYPRRVVQLQFLPGKQLELVSDLGTDSDAGAALATWFKPFGREVIIRKTKTTSRGESNGSRIAAKPEFARSPA